MQIFYRVEQLGEEKAADRFAKTGPLLRFNQIEKVYGVVPQILRHQIGMLARLNLAFQANFSFQIAVKESEDVRVLQQFLILNL